MEKIKQVLDKFLSDQDERLRPRTFKNYKQVIELFEDYLNGYAYNNLDKEGHNLFMEKFNEEEISFCKLFTIEKIGESEINEFITYFLIRKVMPGKEFMKNTGTVMRKLVKWLNENSYINEARFDKLYETVNEVKDELPKVVELSDMLYDNGRKNSFYEYDEYEEDSFIITQVQSGKLWLKEFTETENEMGPVIVPKKISDVTETGWVVYLELGKKEDQWFILGSGHVYPH